MLMKLEIRHLQRRAAVWSFCMLLVASSGVGAGVAPGSEIQASVNHPDRAATDVTRDPGRKPADVMAFFGVARGARVIEIGAGGGYYTELLSRVVADDGLVYAYNPFLFLQFISDEIKVRYSTGRLPNVVMGIGSLSALELRDNSFNAAYLIDTYHDIAYQESTGEAISRPAQATLRELRRILQPGAIVGVIDHRARDNATRAESASIHRIVEAELRRDFQEAGFVLLGSADFLANPSDDRSQAWFSDPGLKDATDRMVLRFKNP